MYNQSRQKDFCWGALIGGGIAVLTSLLFTTKKGRQIQRKIADAYEGAEESIREKFSDVKEKTEEKLSDAKDKVEDLVHHAHKKVAHKTKDDEKDSK